MNAEWSQHNNDILKVYYNSKYIDAEETDVSRNQTSTWLMNSAEVVSKEEIYSSGNLISSLCWTTFYRCLLAGLIAAN